MKRKLILVFALVLAGIAAQQALAADPGSSGDGAACCQLTTSAAQSAIRGRDPLSDERFFMAEGAPPNIYFLFDNSGSMWELPQVKKSNHAELWDSIKGGCNSPTVLDPMMASRGWNKLTAYPVIDPGTSLGSDNGFPNLFQDTKYYTYMSWADNAVRDSPPPMAAVTPAGVCATMHAVVSAEYLKCTTCLLDKGYYKYINATDTQTYDTTAATNARFVFWGRWLNFNGPKYAIGRAAFKGVIKDLQRVRAGMACSTTATERCESRR
jgi:type IV pilus assembly protein PilY1